jgi:hypothetical protein
VFPAAIKATDGVMKDIKAVITDHLHLVPCGRSGTLYRYWDTYLHIERSLSMPAGAVATGVD